MHCLTTALHVSGVTITQLQEHKITITTAFGGAWGDVVVKALRY
jgi:hypothetical protein